MGEKTMYIYGNDVRFGFSKELISKSKVFIYIYIHFSQALYDAQINFIMVTLLIF